ncbi:MAG: hypothetical protein M3N43_06445 [Actinomycetota bacterium]|nr:hypothetical protein [Actinomycetota bacterium]
MEVNQRLGYVILALTLGSVALGVKTTVDRQADAECQSAYIVENARVTKVRAAANQRSDDATSALLSSVSALVLGKPSADASAKFRAAFKRYDRETEAVREDRKNNPLPELPESCDDVKD